jgi:hypothetical protein
LQWSFSTAEVNQDMAFVWRTHPSRPTTRHDEFSTSAHSRSRVFLYRYSSKHLTFLLVTFTHRTYLLSGASSCRTLAAWHILCEVSWQQIFTGWGRQPHAQPPTWRTRVSLLVWHLPRNLSDMGVPTSSYAAAGIALEFIVVHKPPHPATEIFRQGRDIIKGTFTHHCPRFTGLSRPITYFDQTGHRHKIVFSRCTWSMKIFRDSLNIIINVKTIDLSRNIWMEHVQTEDHFMRWNLMITSLVETCSSTWQMWKADSGV